MSSYFTSMQWAALTLVAETHITLERHDNDCLYWHLEGVAIRKESRLDRAFWWLAEAGQTTMVHNRFTKKNYALLTERGRDSIREREELFPTRDPAVPFRKVTNRERSFRALAERSS